MKKKLKRVRSMREVVEALGPITSTGNPQFTPDAAATGFDPLPTGFEPPESVDETVARVLSDEEE